jgi:hypothetical protein
MGRRRKKRNQAGEFGVAMLTLPGDSVFIPIRSRRWKMESLDRRDSIGIEGNAE